MLFACASPPLPSIDDYLLEKLAVQRPGYGEAYAAAAVYPIMAGISISVVLWPQITDTGRRARRLLAFWSGAVVLTAYAMIRFTYSLLARYTAADDPTVFEVTRTLALIGIASMFGGVVYASITDAVAARRAWKQIKPLHTDLLARWPGVARPSPRHCAVSEWVSDRADETLDEHVRDLAKAGRDYDLDLDAEPATENSVIAKLRQKGSELIGGFHEPTLLLLYDLRELHRMAAGVSLDWEILAQTAQALQDRELLATAKRCHPETLRQMRWANAKLKESAAQVLVTG